MFPTLGCSRIISKLIDYKYDQEQGLSSRFFNASVDHSSLVLSLVKVSVDSFILPLCIYNDRFICLIPDLTYKFLSLPFVHISGHLDRKGNQFIDWELGTVKWISLSHFKNKFSTGLLLVECYVLEFKAFPEPLV